MCLSGELVASVHYRPECKKRWAMGALEMYGSRVGVLFPRPLSCRVGTPLILGWVQRMMSWCSCKYTHACTHMCTHTQRLSHTSHVHTRGYIHPGIYTLYTRKHTPH